MEEGGEISEETTNYCRDIRNAVDELFTACARNDDSTR